MHQIMRVSTAQKLLKWSQTGRKPNISTKCVWFMQRICSNVYLVCTVIHTLLVLVDVGPGVGRRAYGWNPACGGSRDDSVWSLNIDVCRFQHGHLLMLPQGLEHLVWFSPRADPGGVGRLQQALSQKIRSLSDFVWNLDWTQHDVQHCIVLLLHSAHLAFKQNSPHTQVSSICYECKLLWKKLHFSA